MTTTNDFDRFLASVLEADGPQVIDATVVDGAIAAAVAIPQRRPIIAGLDGRAWPARVAPVGLGSRRIALIGALGLLVVAMLAVALSAGTPRVPMPLADGERVVFTGSDGELGVVAFVDGNGTSRHTMVARGAGGCTHVLTGTTVAAADSFATWNFVDVTDGSVRFTVPTDYAGFERWSRTGDRLALADIAGSIGMVRFDVRERTIVDVPVSGVAWADWSYDGSKLAIVRVDGTDVVIDVADAMTGARREAYRAQIAGEIGDPASFESGFWIDWGSRGDTVALVRSPTATTDETMLQFVDLASGIATTVLRDQPGHTLRQIAAWSDAGDAYATIGAAGTVTVINQDGTTLERVSVAPDGHGLRWSPDGSAVAFLDAAQTLHVVGLEVDGERTASVEDVTDFTWSSDGSALVVAQISDGVAEIVGYDADALGRLETIGQVDGLERRSRGCVAIDSTVVQP